MPLTHLLPLLVPLPVIPPAQLPLTPPAQLLPLLLPPPPQLLPLLVPLQNQALQLVLQDNMYHHQRPTKCAPLTQPLGTHQPLLIATIKKDITWTMLLQAQAAIMTAIDNSSAQLTMGVYHNQCCTKLAPLDSQTLGAHHLLLNAQQDNIKPILRLYQQPQPLPAIMVAMDKKTAQFIMVAYHHQ